MRNSVANVTVDNHSEYSSDIRPNHPKYGYKCREIHILDGRPGQSLQSPPKLIREVQLYFLLTTQSRTASSPLGLGAPKTWLASASAIAIASRE
jgi:hypothetical protein